MRLFKQISEEYQSLRTLREMLLVCSPCRRGICLPLRDHLIIGRKTERKSVFPESTCVIAPSVRAFWQITAVAGI